MIGMWISRSVHPKAFINERWGLRSAPSVICAERCFVLSILFLPPYRDWAINDPISFVPIFFIPGVWMSAVR